MKKILLIYLLFFATKSFAQPIANYHPFLNCSSRYYITVSFLHDYWWLVEKGDTIVNSFKYRQIVVSDTFGNYSNTISLVREDTLLQKIYMFDTLSNTDKLMVDYSVIVGDTTELYVDSFCQKIFTKAVVTQIDYIDSTSSLKFKGTGKRKLISYYNLHSPVFQYQFCEEVGNLSTQNPFGYSDICYQEDFPLLLSIFHNKVNSALIYGLFTIPNPQTIPIHIINGCKPEKYSYLNRKICYGDSLMFGNSYFNNSGIYLDTLNLANYDSIAQLSLHVLPKVQSVFYTIHMCSGVSNTISDTIYNMLGCDSIYRNYNFVNNGILPIIQYDTAFICSGTPYLMLDTLKNKWGCDSVFQQIWYSLNTLKIDTAIKVYKDSLFVTYSPNYIYQWKDCYNNITISTNNVLHPSDTVTYFLIVKNTTTGCSDTSECHTFTIGIENLTKVELKFYPNPTKELLVVSCKSIVNTISVTNVVGQHQNVKVEKLNTNDFRLTTEYLPSGIYFIKATDINGNVCNGKFVKE